MASTLPWGEEIEILAELGFIVREFTLGDYGTEVTRTNLVTNPSFEVNTTGWSPIGTGTTIARTTSDAYVGSASCQVNKGAVANGRITINSGSGGIYRFPVTAGQPYHASVYVKVPAGQPSCSLRIRTSEFRADGTQNAAQVSATTVVSDTDGWVRLSFADTPTGGATPTVSMIMAVEETTANARTYLVDAFLFEQSSTLRPYFDGSYDAGWSGYILDGALSWSGTAHASTSSGTWGLIGTETGGSQLDGDDVLDGTLEGLDIAPYVQEARISRGRQDQLASFPAGSLSLKLINNDRRFDPLNQASPYWDAAAGRSGVVPRRKVSISADGEPLFVGRIVDVDVAYEPAPSGQDRSTAVLTCADDFQILANTATESPVTPSAELSGARVSYLLDLPEIAYPATRDIDTGISTLGSYQIAANTNALTYLQRIAEAEQGLCFIARNGDLTFLDRAATTFSNPVESFTDSGIGLPYQTLSIRYGSEILFNKVVVTPEGASPQTADDAASQVEFGIQTLSLTDSLLASEGQALTLAEDLIGQYAEPEYRFDGMSLILNDKVEGDRVSILGLEIGDQINITRTFASGSPLQVSDTYQIQSISHQITPGAHTVSIGLAWIPIVYQFILNDAEFGVLDADNALA